MVLIGLYYLLLACLSIYGLHRGVLLYFYATGSNRPSYQLLGDPAQKTGCKPRITVQLPVFNERFVVSSATTHNQVSYASHGRKREDGYAQYAL